MCFAKRTAVELTALSISLGNGTTLSGRVAELHWLHVPKMSKRDVFREAGDVLGEFSCLGGELDEPLHREYVLVFERLVRPRTVQSLL